MRILTPAMLVIFGLLGACAEDATPPPSDGADPLEERPGKLDQSTGKSGAAGQACPAIALAPDGKCEPRDQNVPCPLVDPDCSIEPVACTLIWKPKDGRCDLSDPCAKLQDADCQDDGDMPGCDPGGVICTAIRYADNGKCEAPKGCEQNDPIDCAPVACIEIRYADNGKCEAAKGCEYTDPVDCRAARCLIAVPSDGKCPPAGDPCDPDCH